MLKRIRFIKDEHYPNGRVDKKGTERYVTSRTAQLLIESGHAELIGQETEIIEPEPEKKQEKAQIITKEEKITRKRRTKKVK
jgi:hypothetical protein